MRWWKEIDQLHGRLHGLVGARGARQFDDQRDLQDFAIEEDSVLILAVIPESFAVIRGEDDRRAVVEALLFEKREQLAHDRVRGGVTVDVASATVDVASATVDVTPATVDDAPVTVTTRQ